MLYLCRKFLTMKNLLIVPLFLLIVSCGGPDKKAEENNSTEQAVATPSKYSDQFNQSFGNLLHSYYALKDALVETDTTKANGAALDLKKYADSLPLNDITNDSTGAIKETA